MNGLDFIIILILIASVIYSIFRGFVREVFSLISIILGFMAAIRCVFGVTMMILILIAFLPPAPPILTKSRLTPYFITLGELSINMIPVNLKQTVREKKEILILKILNVFLRLKFSSSLSAGNAQAGLTLNKIEHFSKVSIPNIVLLWPEKKTQKVTDIMIIPC